MKRVTLLVVLAVFAMIGTAQAQEKGAIEIGADNAIGYDITGKLADFEQPDQLFVVIPFGYWRFGFFLNEKISIEPGVGFQFISLTDDAGSGFTLTGTADLLYHLQPNLFVNVGGVIDLVNIDPGGAAESSTSTQFGFGAGLGYRMELVPSLYLRLGARGWYLLESEDDGLPSSIRLAGTFGFSFFTK
ncbi:MAG TPA: hypothetical protein VLC48_02100 [Gemmatimonadota bacterium]|nr:hypothetical protein [Gemmatimonadota bacterium]